MDVSRVIEINSISEIRILSNVRLISKRDLNPIYSKENLQVQFRLSGELRGAITCFLCLDKQELSSSDKNYIFPLFVESMNILIGKQLSTDEYFKTFNVKLSPPKLSMLPKEINTSYKSGMQSYQLELDGLSFLILTEYSLEAMN